MEQKLNKKTPEVSVIIPTHNRANLLKRAIKSVLSQGYRDFELIIVDDASTDGTESTVNNFQDSRIKYVCHQKNKGGSAARNTGIQMSKGKYIGLLDDDDQWLPDKLSKQVDRFRKAPKRVGIIYSGCEVQSEDGRVIRRYYPQYKGDLRLRLLKGTSIASPTPLIKKECFIKTGKFDESLKSCQDWDMWKRISEYYEFDYVPEILAITYLHKEQISFDLASMIPGRTRMVEKHKGELKKYPDVLVIHLKRLGKLHCINGSWKEARYWFKRAIEINHFEIIKILAWCVLELPRIKYFSNLKNFKKY